MFHRSLLIIIVYLLSTFAGFQGCPFMKCSQVSCGPVPTNCKGGLALDICGCCQVCALVEDEVCGRRSGIFGTCDKDLECTKKKIFIEEVGVYETEFLCKVPGCTDQAKYQKKCSSWVLSGQCIRNAHWMNENCCKSCRSNSKDGTIGSTCSDIEHYQSKCPDWAANDQCNINYKWMWKNCCKSCKSSLNKTCTDTTLKCTVWAADGECKKNKNWMLDNCCASCKDI